MTNTPKILSNDLDQAPKVWEQYEKVLNDPEVHDHIIQTFDKDKKKIDRIKSEKESEFKKNPEGFYQKHLLPEDFLALKNFIDQAKSFMIPLSDLKSNTQFFSIGWYWMNPQFDSLGNIDCIYFHGPDIYNLPAKDQINLIKLVNDASSKFKNIHFNKYSFRYNWVITWLSSVDEINKITWWYLDFEVQEGLWYIGLMHDFIEKVNLWEITTDWNCWFGTYYEDSKLEQLLEWWIKTIPGNVRIMGIDNNSLEEITWDLFTNSCNLQGLKKVWGKIVDNSNHPWWSFSLPNIESLWWLLDLSMSSITSIDKQLDKLTYVWWGISLNNSKMPYKSLFMELKQRIESWFLTVTWDILVNGHTVTQINGKFNFENMPNWLK